MSVKRQSLSRVLILLFILNAGVSFGQAELIDTTEYVSYIFSDALEYNLLIAASKGYVSEINRLAKKGADVNVETTNGVTPLIIAVASNKPDAVAALLSYHADVNKFTALNETPLLIAVKNNYFTVAEKLIRDSADVNLADMYGATPLHYAVLYGYTDIADMLIYYDADINAVTKDGSTPLMASVWAGSYLSTGLLLKNGANVEEKDNQGFTPFLLASWFGDTATMNLLYTSGANIFATSNKGHNAMTLAIISGHLESVNYLLSIGNKWEGKAQTASDPYLVASKYGRKDIIDLLHQNDIPGKVRYQVDQFTLAMSERFAFHDMLTGFSLSFKEPLLNSGFIAGCDFKPWSTRVLIRDNAEEFHQYFDRGSVAYAGLFKDFELNKQHSTSVALSTSLLAAYSFGNYLRGTTFTPENKFKIIPSVSLKINYGSLSLFAGIEYIRTPFYKSGPVWLRIGTGYTSFFNNIRTRVKLPKWY